MDDTNNDEGNPTALPQEGGGWYIPCRQHKLADGTFLIKPGKPVQRGTTNQVAKATGIGYKTLIRLADAGFLRRAQPSPGLSFFYYAEVEALIRRTERDPDFWTTVRREAYLTGRSIREARGKS
jgi:hypothetical protein